MLNDFSWNMTGYIPKHQVNPHGDGIIPYVAERIFQLEPEPPAVDSLNEYILSALREKNLLYFSFFLHHYEMEMSRNVQSGNTQNLKSMVIQRSFPKWSVAERRKTAAASDQAAVCACAHSRYFTGGSPSGLRV